MSSNENKILIQEYIEKVWNSADMEAFKHLTTPSFSYQIANQPVRNSLEMEKFILSMHSTFPDWRIEIIDIFAEEHKVAIRWQGQITHQGNFHGVLPTGKQINIGGINIYHIANGKITAEWEQTNTLSMLQQMGALPTGKI